MTYPILRHLARYEQDTPCPACGATLATRYCDTEVRQVGYHHLHRVVDCWADADAGAAPHLHRDCPNCGRPGPTQRPLDLPERHYAPGLVFARLRAVQVRAAALNEERAS